MNWYTATVATADLASLLARIRNMGGTIARTIPGADGIRVTWTTTSSGNPPSVSRLSDV